MKDEKTWMHTDTVPAPVAGVFVPLCATALIRRLSTLPRFVAGLVIKVWIGFIAAEWFAGFKAGGRLGGHPIFTQRLSVPGRVTAGFFVIAACAPVVACEDGVHVGGWIEKAILFPGELPLHAKLDTGAKTSSIHAAEPVFFERDGIRWARFSVTNRDKHSLVLERPVVRVATIKRHFGEAQKRPVITLDFCVGPVRKTVEVNLVDRAGFDYQLLIGRNFLADDIVVDSGRTYILQPHCSEVR